MSYSDQFFKAVGIRGGRGGNLARFAKETGVPSARLKYYNETNILPSGNDLKAILQHSKISEIYLQLAMGRVDKDILAVIQANAAQVETLLKDSLNRTADKTTKIQPNFKTKLGKLYQADCIELMKSLKNDSVDLIFADPPFNLSKLYPSEINDNLKTEKYIHWCEQWLYECIRILKPGGALFLWNLPKWNIILANFIGSYLTFRHWIGVDIKYSLPIQSRLYPSHYSLLYYVKGPKPNTFHPDRLPMQTCPKCFGDLKDYGGYKDKMNPEGINLTDIWADIPPVRHAKYKRRVGANELSIKLLDRIIEMASNKGDLVFDPFGGSGTTFMAAELKKRKWIGCEIGPLNDIEERFNLIDSERDILNAYRAKTNALFTEDVKQNRMKRGLWTCESFQEVAQEELFG